jgi:hypothetical protein
MLVAKMRGKYLVVVGMVFLEIQNAQLKYSWSA